MIWPAVNDLVSLFNQNMRMNNVLCHHVVTFLIDTIIVIIILLMQNVLMLYINTAKLYIKKKWEPWVGYGFIN